MINVSFTGNADSVLKWISCEATDGDFIPVKQRNKPKSQSVPEKDKSDESEEPETSDESEYEVAQGAQKSKPTLFACAEDSCVKSYLTHGRLERHLLYGKHQFKLERMTMLDRAKISYAQHLEAGSEINVALTGQESMTKEHQSKKAARGWSLKETEKKYKRFSDKQKGYLDKKFVEGENTGVKCSGEGERDAVLEGRKRR